MGWFVRCILSYNLNRKQDRALLFEVGSGYHAAPKGYQEQQKLAGLFYGDFQPEQWAAPKREVDFYDVKATVDMLTKQQAEYRVEAHAALHPGQTARIYINGQAQGWFGKLHPKWQQHYNLPKATFLFELNVDTLLSSEVPVYQEVSKFLGVRRDIAVIVDASVQVEAIIQAVKAAQIPLLQQIQLFDVYQGKGIAENKKSLAFLVLIQDTHKTLVDTKPEPQWLSC